jgi:methylated-DNA-protein-cysteine methyltransferase related protein
MNNFSEHVVRLIQQIPYGRVSTYGAIAEQAGNTRGARLVSYILHSGAQKYNLPWHRVVGKGGLIKIHDPIGQNIQRDLLQTEGISIINNTLVDFNEIVWTQWE